MASNNDIEKLKVQDFEEPIKHNDEVGPVGNLFESCVQILRSLSTKARELDAASRKHHHPDGPQRSESANESSSAQSRKEERVRKMAKWGCMTCRKRQKQCDEGKPECNNCVRGGFICEGYIIKSTGQKPEALNSNPSGQGTETSPKSGQPMPLDGAASQLLVKTLESNVATLLFWDDEFGALSGHLDKALEHSEENRDLTLATLISLADFLSHDLLNATLPLPAYRDDIRQKSNIHARVDKARGTIMDTEKPDREETRNIEDVCEILDSKVARLNVLGPILEESIPSGAAFEQVAAHGQLDDRPAHQYYADQISIRFPNASASLVEVLGKCNWERYMRIHKTREENTQREGSPIGETENMSKFHDSGLGTSVPTHSVLGDPRGSFTYAETEVSRRAEASHRRLPPLPEEGRNGRPFLCGVCNSVMRIRRTNAWKKHVFSDVLAYVCIFDDCPSDRCFFEDRDAMTAHLGNQHGFAPAWKSETCPLCLEDTGDGMNTISMHFTRHMEEVALGAIPRTAESDVGSDESSSEASSENGRRNILPDYDSDDAYPKSPGLQPIKIKSTPSPSPPPHSAPVIAQAVSPTTSSSRRRKRNNRTRPSQGDAVLLSFLEPGRPDIVRPAGEKALDSDSDPEPSDSEDGTPGSPMQTNEKTATVRLAETALKKCNADGNPVASKPKLAPPVATATEVRSEHDDEENINHQPWHDDEEQSLLKPFKCPVVGCEKAYKNENGLKYHKQHGHQNSQLMENADGTFSIVDPVTSVPYPGTIGIEKEKPYRCETCGKRYKNLNGLKYHHAHSPPCNLELWPNDGEMAAPMAMKQALMDQHHDNFEVPSKGKTSSLHRYADELRNLDAMARVSKQSAQSAQSSNATIPPSFRNLLTDRLQAAHQARSKSPEYSSRGISPFKQGSPLAPPSGPSDTFSSTQMHQATAEQSREPYLPKMEANFMKDFNCCGLTLDSLHELLQHYEEVHGAPSATMQRPSISDQSGFDNGGEMQRQSGTSDPRTISPKNALLDYLEAEEDSVMPFSPGASQGPSRNYAQQQQPSIALPSDMGMQQQDSYVPQDSPPNSSSDQGGQGGEGGPQARAEIANDDLARILRDLF